jgi:type IV pilus assembly protein PilM
MTRRQRGWIGIDLGTRAIKIAQVERVGAGLRLVDAVVMQRGQRGADDPDDIAWRATEIRAALTLAPKLRGRVAACCLSPQQTTLRTMRLPLGTLRQQRAMIAHQLAPRLGLATQTSAFDYWELESSDRGADDKQKLAVISVEEQAAVDAAREIERAGLECRVLDAQPLALSRAVDMLQPHGATTVHAVFDWGFDRSTLNIVRQGVPQFTRELRRCGLSRTVGELSQALGISPDDAQQVLTQYGLPIPGSDQASGDDETCQKLQQVVEEVISPFIHELTGEIEKTLHYLRFQRPELNPQCLYLVGGGASLRNIDQHLAHFVSLPLSLWTMPLGSARLESGHRLSLPMLASTVALSALAWVK